MRVLVVDDDPQILRAVRTSLRARGFDVHTAPNGETALEALSEEGAELVILDLGLPGLDGQEVLGRLRSWSDVPVIVLTVRDAQSEKVAALDAGADDYIVKPFAMEELLARMRAVRRRVSAGASEAVLRFAE
ncbi:MAG TPA: response regulator, partial [Actinomycetota bacterium]|nr:response regulator [Actinomycetota bacterium]